MPDGMLLASIQEVLGFLHIRQNPCTPMPCEAGKPHARYVIVTRSDESWHVEHHAVTYDWEAAARLAEENRRPDWAAWLRTGRA